MLSISQTEDLLGFFTSSQSSLGFNSEWSQKKKRPVIEENGLLMSKVRGQAGKNGRKP